MSDAPAGVEISTDPARLDLDTIHGFLRESYWARGRARSIVERAIANSLCFGAYTDGAQVGFARVATDRAVFAYLMDVFVLPAFQRRGIGRALVEHVLAHPDLQNLRYLLLATKDAHRFYARLGFAPLPAPERWMAIHRPDSDLRID